VDLQWVLEQLEGLCDALQKLHARNWRHGDLKPENILCFEDARTKPGVLVIADVGLLRVQSVHTHLRDAPTRTMTGTWFYCPPQDRGSPRSRQYDVWSMGGIILEIIICALYGPEEVQKLHDMIERFYVGDGTANARVNPKVEQWIQYMYQDPRCGTSSDPTALRLLLDLVHQRLLVVKIRHEQSAGSIQSFVDHHPIEFEGQSDIPKVTVEYTDSPSVEVTPSPDSFRDNPIQETTEYRADSNELHETVRYIRERCTQLGSTRLPLIQPSDLHRPYPGPSRTTDTRTASSSRSSLVVPSSADVTTARGAARPTASGTSRTPQMDTEVSLAPSISTFSVSCN
jgi:serine/threonine protein kinase